MVQTYSIDFVLGYKGLMSSFRHCNFAMTLAVSPHALICHKRQKQRSQPDRGTLRSQIAVDRRCRTFGSRSALFRSESEGTGYKYECVSESITRRVMLDGPLP